MSALILALNPSIDAEWRVADVLWEEKNSVASERRWAGGKGINVARWLKHLGGPAQLVLPLGGRTGAELVGHLRSEKIPATIIRLREPTRVNVIVTTDGGRQMRFNPLGPELSQAEWRKVMATVALNLAKLHSPQSVRNQRAEGAGKGLLILSGSLPRGIPVSAYAQLTRLAHHHGVPTLLDCDGPAFTAGAKARPFLVKPNEHELAGWWGRPLRSEAAILRAALALSAQTRGWVLVSRGGHRSLLVNGMERFQAFARPPRVKPRNTVGAGDALLAAVARQLQLGASPREWLEFGLQTGSAATQLTAGQLPGH